MSPALIALILGCLAAGFVAARYDLPGWVLHLWARLWGATWFTPKLRCPSCGRRVHLVRHRPDWAGIFGMADGGGRCLSCSGGPAGNAPGNASGAARDGFGVLPGMTGYPRARSDAHRDAEGRDDERNDHA